jgi:hypothetical protein
MSHGTTIESFFALINGGMRTTRVRTFPGGDQPITLREGQVRTLPAGRYTVISGRLWLTHANDRRDHFPRQGDSFDTSAARGSVGEALTECTVFFEPA